MSRDSAIPSAPTPPQRQDGPLLPSATDLPFIALAVAAAILLTWVLQLPSSLWIDELGTFWVIDGDLAATASRAWRFQGQTPFYYAIVWGVVQIMGDSEVMLRLPSLVSMLTSAFLLYRFAGRLLDQTAAVMSLAAFIVYPNVGLYAGDARPYALALLATLVATILLERWIRTADIKIAAWYGLAAAAVVYAHYVFASIFVAHLIFYSWVTSRSQTDRRRRLRKGAFWALGVFLIATAPTVTQVINLLERSPELVLSAPGQVRSLIEIWVPPLLSVVLLTVIALGLVRGHAHRELPRDPLIFIGLGFLVPPLVLLGFSMSSDIVLWTPRYWFVTAPYGAMVFGALITSALRTARSVKYAIVGLLVGGMVVGTSLGHSSEDWKSTMSFANSIAAPDTAGFIYSGLIELTSPDYLVDPEKRSYVNSPLAYYPLATDAAPLPWTPFERQSELLLPILSGIPEGNPVLIITNEARGSPLSFISGWLLSNGYERTEAKAFGALRVAAFTMR